MSHHGVLDVSTCPVVCLWVLRFRAGQYGSTSAALFTQLTPQELAAQQLVDLLQTPLQPYRDNLDAEVYDIFEKDNHKYDEYELAFREFFDAFKEPRTVVAYYLGSGKGLILDKLVRAAKKCGKRIKVYCVEKNPYPIQTLKRRIGRNKWSKFVEVVEADIKGYVMPESPDLIFS